MGRERRLLGIRMCPSSMYADGCLQFNIYDFHNNNSYRSIHAFVAPPNNCLGCYGGRDLRILLFNLSAIVGLHYLDGDLSICSLNR